MLGTLFGIGIIGGLNGPLAQANLQQASTNLPATKPNGSDGVRVGLDFGNGDDPQGSVP